MEKTRKMLKIRSWPKGGLGESNPGLPSEHPITLAICAASRFYQKNKKKQML